MYWKKVCSLISALVICIALAGTAWAATHTEFVTGNPVYRPANDHSVYIISNTVDFADLSTAGLSGVTTGDVVQLLDIPAGTIVKNVGVYIYSAISAESGTTATGATVGDGADPNGWITTVDLARVAAAVSGVSNSNGAYVLGTTDFDIGKYYATADTIDMTITLVSLQARYIVSGLTDLQVQVWAECITPSTQNAYGKLR